MSAKYPEWYELPSERWRDTTSKEVYRWNAKDQEREFCYEKCPTMNDFQRRKVYNAETSARNAYTLNENNNIRKFNSMDEIEEYISKLLKSEWVIKRWGRHRLPTLYDGGDQHYAWCQKSKGLSFPRWAWNECTVLHEVAHWIHKPYHGVAHGRFFARTLLELYGHQLGETFRSCVKSAFKTYGVKYRAYPAYSKETLEKKREQGRKLAEQKHDPSSILRA